MNTYNPTSIAAPSGAYSQGISAPGSGHWLYIAGQVGIKPDGTLAQGLERQAETAWMNLIAVLTNAGMDVENLVKVQHFLVAVKDVGPYGAVRTRYLGAARPTSTLLIVQALAKPEWLVEIDAVAWKA